MSSLREILQLVSDNFPAFAIYIVNVCDFVGSFFRKYPRHRKVISINKRYTGNNNSFCFFLIISYPGSTNEEFNFRHDWNSLISHHPDLKMKYYSKDYFPHADEMV